MKKLVISITLCLLPVLAKADFTPYASIIVGVENGQSFNQGTDLATNGKLQNATLIEDFGSFIGFRGTEKIDANLHLDWQIEQYLTMDNSTVVADKNTLANKDSFVGLFGHFGSLRVGRISLIPKSDMEYVDPWTHDGKGVNGLAIFTRFDNRLNNALKYETPGYFGSKVILLYSPDEKKDPSGKAKDALNAALIYKDSNYFAAYSYYIKNNTNGGQDSDVWHRFEMAADQQVWMLSLGYQSVKGYTSGLAYNSASYQAQTGSALNGTQKIEGTEYSATLNYTFQGKLTYRVSYAMGTAMKINEVEVTDTGYDQYVVGANYLLSEKAKTFLSYGQVNWKGNYSGTQDKIVENNLALGISLDI